MSIQTIATQKLEILWQPAKTGVRILRIYGEHPLLHLPEKIEGMPVTEIGAYCFSRSEPSLPEKYFRYRIGLSSDSTHSLFPLSGDAVEEIILPGTVTTLHNAAFYNCRRLHTLHAGQCLNAIGSDEFTNCMRLHRIIFSSTEKNASALSLLLERLSGHLEVQFHSQGTMTSALIFPEYYEWLDEISPAHIFSRSIHGEGFRMRKCFTNGGIDHMKYDRCFDNALKSETDSTLCQIASCRLRWPVGLSDSFRTSYENALRERIHEALSMAIKEKDRDFLLFLCRHYFSAKEFQNAASQCIEADWGEGSALLIEAQHRQCSPSRKCFSFDDNW
ncbi:MAG: leucine-rich repeat protein [Eubacteriales bacterium]|nr:leucine-rich repeat protein [Eubacteriales bacterium]